jgi:DNA ligase D-like protein (predicted 3'-phosphoesterase)
VQIAAIRAVVRGRVQGVGLRDAVRRRAVTLGINGWVRNDDDAVTVHAEGSPAAIEELTAFLGGGPCAARVDEVNIEGVAPEGHEQFAIRGVAAGAFVIREHSATTRHFDLRLEVDGAMRSWALPKGPSLDPAVKRLAVAVADHPIEADHLLEGGRAIVWDRGSYEQGGRVPWPEALARGHAVFALHGEKLRGGFALQRTGSGPSSQWLLIKRRDECARPGSDIAAERPESVLSGRTLPELLD